MQQNNEMNERYYYIDFLKVVGLTGIIIAHVGSPNWAMMLRSFDVPLMVIISSVLAKKSYNKNETLNLISAKKYLIARFKRLVIPVWIFLTFYFLFYAIYFKRIEAINYYIASYCLTRYGIGFVWIILIYLYSAICIPLFSSLSPQKSCVLIGVSYILYEIAFHFSLGIANKFIDTTFYYIIPYGLLTYLGYSYDKMGLKLRFLIMLISFVFFVLFGSYYWIVCGTFQIVQIAKYPPRIYFLSYGIMCSFLFLLVCENCQLRLFNNRLVRFVSTHSLWIYLWHIFVLTLYSILKLPEIWFLKLLIVYMVSLIIVYAVNIALDFINKKKELKFLNYLRG